MFRRCLIVPIVLLLSAASLDAELELAPVEPFAWRTVESKVLIEKPVDWNPAKDRSLAVDKLPMADWSKWDELVLDVETSEASTVPLRIDLSSPGEPTRRGVFYEEVPIGFKGRRTLRLRFRDTFRGWGHPGGFDDIRAVRLRFLDDPKITLKVHRLAVVDYVDPVDEMVREKNGRYVIPTTVSNRYNVAGVIYYVNVPKDAPAGAAKVLLRHRSRGTRGDFNGEPANLILRVFDPNDRPVFVANLGTEKPGWHETSMDLAGQPAGRYRFSLTGYHDGFVLATEAGTPVGFRGAGSVGLAGPDDYYVFVPKDVTRWRIGVKGQLPGQKVIVYDDKGEVAAEKLATGPNSYWQVWDGEELSFKVERPGTVWRIRHAGTGGLKLQVYDVPGVLWPDADSARANAGDCEFVAGRRVNHRWQRPFAQWLAERKAEDFAMKAGEFPELDIDHLPDEQAVRLSKAAGPYATFGACPTLLKVNQIVDPGSVHLGYFVDAPEAFLKGDKAVDKNDPGRSSREAGSLNLNADSADRGSFYQVGFVLSASGLLTTPAFGKNPYFEDPGLTNRVVAAICQLMLKIPERQHVDLSFVHKKMFGKIATRMYRYLPEQLREPFRVGLIENMGRDAYFDGYVSNQNMNNILGLKHIADVTGDAELQRYYQQRIKAFLEDRYYSDNHGQVPAGYYQEVSGFDGAYNTYSAQVKINLWRHTDDARLHASLVKNFEFVRHLAVTMPDGTYTSARNWNTRTDSNAFRWHRHRHGADIPGCATFLFGKRGDRKTFDEAAESREHLRTWWGKTYEEAKLDGRKWWSGFSVDLVNECPPHAQPLEVACHEAPGVAGEHDLRPDGVTLDREAGEFIRRYGAGYLFVRTGPWYAVFFSGDRGGAGKSGSGLSMLWHRQFGPLICGDTKIKSKSAAEAAKKLKDKSLPLDARKELELMFVLCDAWDEGAGDTLRRVDTEAGTGRAEVRPGDETTHFSVDVTASPRRNGDWTLARRYAFLTDGGVSSDASVEKSTFADHALYLPLVTGPAVTLACLDAEGKELELKPGQRGTVSAWRWTLAEGKGGEGEASITLSFDEPVEVFVRADEPCAPTTLRIFRVLLKDKPGRFTVK